MTDQTLRAGVASLTVVAVALFMLDVSGPVRTAALVAFVFFAPGLAWSRVLRLRDLTDTIAIGVALGVGFAVVVGETMALVRWWSPGTGLAVLTALTLAGLAVRVPELQEDSDSRR